MSDLAVNSPNILSYNTEKAEPIVKKTYETLTIYDEKNPMLTQKMEDFDVAHPPVNIIDFCNQLLATMNKYGGAGLAAPQCGFPYRIFVMVGGIVCINPVITQRSKEVDYKKEGCLSFPGLYLPVTRPETIQIEYINEFGKRITATWNGATARIAQHEYDHLEGILFTSLVGNLTRQMAKKKRAKLFKKIQRVVEFKEQQLRIAGKDKEYVAKHIQPRPVAVESHRAS